MEKLLNIVLRVSHFSFNSQIFLQIKGLAMGNRLSGLLASIYMDRLERQTIYGLDIIAYKRYVDDIVMIMLDEANAKYIFEDFNKANSNIKLDFGNPQEWKTKFAGFLNRN